MFLSNIIELVTNVMGHMQNNLLQCPTLCVTLLIIWFFFFDKSDFCGICDTFLSKCHAKNFLFLKCPWNCVAQYMIILYMPQKSHKRPKSWSQSDPFSISAWHFLRKFHICHPFQKTRSLCGILVILIKHILQQSLPPTDIFLYTTT